MQTIEHFPSYPLTKDLRGCIPRNCIYKSFHPLTKWTGVYYSRVYVDILPRWIPDNRLWIYAMARNFFIFYP